MKEKSNFKIKFQHSFKFYDYKHVLLSSTAISKGVAKAPFLALTSAPEFNNSSPILRKLSESPRTAIRCNGVFLP